MNDPWNSDLPSKVTPTTATWQVSSRNQAELTTDHQAILDEEFEVRLCLLFAEELGGELTAGARIHLPR